MDQRIKTIQEDAAKAGIKITQKRAKEIAESFEKFTGTDFSRIAAYNRGGEKELSAWLKKTGWEPTDKMMSKIIQEAKDIEDYVKFAPRFTEETKIFRGIQNGKDVYSKLSTGSIIDMQGSTSFSSNIDKAALFSDEKAGCIFELKEAPDLSTSIKHLAINPGEEEVLVSSQTKFRITGKTSKVIDDEKLLIIQLEAI